MNSQIVKLFGFIVVLFATLIGFTSYWSVFDAEELRAEKDNKRPLLEALQIRRGAILAADGSVIAESFQQGRGNNRVFKRRYPLGSLFGHPIGYSFVERGQVAFEQFHNDELIGEKSEFTSVLDQLRGRAQEGNNIVTTLIPSVQRAALDALGGERGSIVAIEPDSGRVLAMVSYPPYDPNLIKNDAAFRDFNTAEMAPLLNRATLSGYPPGSTMKVVTAAAALDSGEFSADSVLNGDTGISIGGSPLENFGSQSFGDVDLTTALTNSVNTVWGQVGEQLGTETMFRYMTRFGFNDEPPIDLPTDELVISGVYEGGNLLGPAATVDIGRVAIGQERLLVTPLQMAMVAAAVANDGVLMKPRLWDKIVDPDGRLASRMNPEVQAEVMSPETAETLSGMMQNVVNEGTGGAAALSGINVAGKTGTAERFDRADCDLDNQAWFIGFAPAEDPEVAVAATVECTSSTGGDAAAPIAGAVMEAVLSGG